MTESQYSKVLSGVQGFLGWGTLLAVLGSSIILGANRPVLWTFLALAVLVLFTAQGLLTLLQPPAPALSRALPYIMAYGAVLLWAVLQAILPVSGMWAHPAWSEVTEIVGPEGTAPRISADPGRGGHFVLRLACYGAVAWLLAASALRTKRAWAYLRAIAGFSALLAAYGIAMVTLGMEAAIGVDRPVPAYVTATFVNRNSYAFYGAMGLIVNLALLVNFFARHTSADSERDVARTLIEAFFSGAWVYAVGVILCGVAVAMTESRAGAGAAAAGVLVFLLARGWRRRQTIVPLLTVPLPLLAYVALSFGSGTLERFADADISGRIAVYSAIVENLGERLWLGHGLGAFHDTFRPFLPIEVAAVEWDVAHNSYLENIWELGLVAALVFYGLLLAVVWRLARGTVVRRQNASIPAIALGVVAAGAVHSTVEFPLQIPACAALFAALLGIGWAQSFRQADRLNPTRLQAKRAAQTARPSRKTPSEL